jgi:hypothetical protein
MEGYHLPRRQQRGATWYCTRIFGLGSLDRRTAVLAADDRKKWRQRLGRGLQNRIIKSRFLGARCARRRPDCAVNESWGALFSSYPTHQLSRNLLSSLERLGCLSFRSALASICRIRSRVTENCLPTSSSVWSLFMPRPKRMRTMRSSRGVSEASRRGWGGGWNGGAPVYGYAHPRLYSYYRPYRRYRHWHY